MPGGRMNRIMWKIAPFLLVASAAFAQQPTVTAVMNNFSYTLPFSPTYGTCSTLADAGKFIVPSAVTLSLPPTAVLDGIVSASFLSVTNYANPQSFTAPGVDFGLVFGYNTGTTTDISNFQYQ